MPQSTNLGMSSALTRPLLAGVLGLIVLKVFDAQIALTIPPLESELEEVQAAVSRMQQMAPPEVQRVRAAANRDRVAVATAEQTFPPSPDMVALLRRIDEAGRAHHLEIGTLTPDDKAGIPAVLLEPYRIESYGITAHGRWSDLNALVREWNDTTSSAVVTIESIKSGETAADRDVLTANLAFTIVTNPVSFTDAARLAHTSAAQRRGQIPASNAGLSGAPGVVNGVGSPAPQARLPGVGPAAPQSLGGQLPSNSGRVP